MNSHKEYKIRVKVVLVFTCFGSFSLEYQQVIRLKCQTKLVILVFVVLCWSETQCTGNVYFGGEEED